MIGQTAPFLALREVQKIYNDGHAVHALRPTSLDVSAGDYLTITGPSGSGKSTLMNILGLLDQPTSGSYQVRDVEMTQASDGVRGAVRGQLFGFVFQAFHLLPGRSVFENVELGMLCGPHRPRTRRALAAAAIEKVGLEHRRDSDPRNLSGGERQRVAIARAIAPSPRLLLCDEPTGNLDSANTESLLRLLGSLNEAGLTLVVVTHDPHVASQGHRTTTVVDGVVHESETGRCDAS